MVADQVAHVAHLNARDTTLAFVSRVRRSRTSSALKARMGWEMPWYTITDGFDSDFGVGEWHGTNAFIRDGDRVFRTYFIDNRGDEAMGSTWSYLDITRARAPGGMGGLAGGLPSDSAVRVVELARRVRERGGDPMTEHRTGTREEWLAARIELLEQEKELTRRSDELARSGRSCRGCGSTRSTSFQTDDGPKTLAELFDGRSQLIVYHLMYGPDDEAACPGCSFYSDHLDGSVAHLNNHDVTLVCASRAPLEKLQAYKRRMGWKFPWVSSDGTDFNLDFGLFTEEERRTGTGYNFGTPRSDGLKLFTGEESDDEMMGLSVFALEDGVVYHTYSTFDRGTDVLNGTWQLLDRAPKGRFEAPSEADASGDWPRRHDEYEDAAAGAAAS